MVIRPDEIGDVVLTSSFFRGLRESSPNAFISVVTNSICFSLLENCPYIDQLNALPFKGDDTKKYLETILQSARTLKSSSLDRRFDAVLLPRLDVDYYKAREVAGVLGGRARIFQNSESFIVRDNPNSRGKIKNSEFSLVSKPQSEVHSNLDFLKSLGGHYQSSDLEFWYSKQDEEIVDCWLRESGIVKPFLVFHPLGSRSLLRRWPAGRCGEFINRILEETEFSVVVVGGALEMFIKEELSDLKSPRVHVAIDMFSLTQLGVLIQRSGFFVGGDSGPMHIAAAVGAKTIGVFGPGSITRFRPFSVNADVVSLKTPCSPDQMNTFVASCHQCIHTTNQCLAELPVDALIRKILEFFCTRKELR